MSLDPSLPPQPSAPPPLGRLAAAVDAFAVVLIVPAASILAGLVAAIVGGGEPVLSTALALQAVFALAGVHALLAARDQSFAHIGLHWPTLQDLVRAPIVLLAVLVTSALLNGLIMWFAPDALRAHLSGLENVTGLIAGDASIVVTALLMLLVGLYEEVAARGVLLQRLLTITGGHRLAAAVVSSLLFALGHFYQGAYGVVQTAVFGFVLALFVLRWGSLWPVILAHAAINTYSIWALNTVGIE